MPQVVVEKEDSGASRAQAQATALRKIIPAYLGETVTLGLNVYGPKEHVVEILVEGMDLVASVSVQPNRARAPCTVSITIKVNSGAKPSLYPFSLKSWDETERRLLAVDRAALLVLKREVPKTLAQHYHDAKSMFTEYGSAGLVWYTLKCIYPKGAVFREIRTIYELVVGREVSGGTISNILSRLVSKGVISRGSSV